MKYILPLIFLLGCGAKQSVKDECKLSEGKAEKTLFEAYNALGAETKLCHLMSSPFHYRDKENWHKFDYCKPMPKVVKVKCFRSCSSYLFGCLIFHSNGYVLKGVYKIQP